jgi:hypothetical protein
MMSDILSNPQTLLTFTAVSAANTCLIALVIFNMYKYIVLKVNPKKYLNLVTKLLELGISWLDDMIDEVKENKKTYKVGEDLQAVLLNWLDSLIGRLQILRKKLED